MHQKRTHCKFKPSHQQSVLALKTIQKMVIINLRTLAHIQDHQNLDTMDTRLMNVI